MNYPINDIIRFMTHDSLLLYKKKNSKISVNADNSYEHSQLSNQYRPGITFVSSSKENLAAGKGYIVTSYETLYEQSETISHWTPNTFRFGTYTDYKKTYIKGHTKDNLKQINVFGYDIDQQIEPYSIYLGCLELGLPAPNLLLKTARGLQFFFVLDKPFYINKGYKSLRVAEKIHKNIGQALSKYTPIDTNCLPFGFFRFPNAGNVLHFQREAVATNLLIDWSTEYESAANTTAHTYKAPKENVVDLTQTDWYKALINVTTISKGHYTSSRNNALFTLALANYTSGYSFEHAYNVLDEFNSNLVSPLSKREFDRTMKSAFSGKYKGVQRNYVETLLTNWVSDDVTIQLGTGWHKFKKERVDRQRSHYTEWENDIIEKIHSETCAHKPFLEGSLASLSDTFKVPLSSLKVVLKRSSKLIKITTGKGRNATTKITSKFMYMRHLVNLMKINKHNANKQIRNLFQVQETLELNKPVIETDEVRTYKYLLRDTS